MLKRSKNKKHAGDIPRLKKPINAGPPKKKLVSRHVDISGDLESQASAQPTPTTLTTVPEPVPGPSGSAPVSSTEKEEVQRKGREASIRFTSKNKGSTLAPKKKTSERAEQLQNAELPSDILNSRRPATKVRFTPNKPGSHSRQDIDLDDYRVKESLEINQGISKIKLEDWFPFFDFQYNAKKAATETTTADVEKGSEDGDGDNEEWEESLVYVDLEDIPHVDGLLKSLGPENTYDPNEDEAALLSRIETKIFNMDSKLPVLLMGGKYLAGHWQDSPGTSLFFKKKEEDESESEQSSSAGTSQKLKSIIPEPEIPFDPLFGDNYASVENEYELVAKSFKILKVKYFPPVNEEHNLEDFIRDNDDEFDPRDFQIPPINMVRQFTTANDLSYEKYKAMDIERRKKIREKWGEKKDDADGDGGEDDTPIVKTEPITTEQENSDDDEDSFFVTDINFEKQS